MIQTIANHLLQSTIFAAVAGILTIFLRHNQSADALLAALARGVAQVSNSVFCCLWKSGID